MNKKIIDQDGNSLTKSVRRERNGWGANVWFGGGLGGCATNIRRYIYATRKAASSADISDEIGKSGRIA